MVKVIRCSSKNEINADFISYFNEQIKIKPGAKIALESMSVEIDTAQDFKVPLNFNFTIQNALEDQARICTVPSGSKTQDQFLIDITNSFNTSCDWRVDISGINTEYKPFYDENNKLNIQWLTNIQDSGSKLLDLCSWNNALFTITPGDIPEDDIIELTEYPDDGSQIILVKTPASLNSGGISCRLMGNTTEGNQQTGFVLSLVDSTVFPLIKKGNEIPVTNIGVKLGILVMEDGTIEVWSAGSKLPLVQPISVQTGAGNNNYTDFRIYKKGNRLIVYVQRQDMPNALDIIQTIRLPTTAGDLLFGYINFKEVGTVLTKLNYLASPYTNSNNTGLSIIKYNSEKQDIENYMTYDDVGQPALLPSTHTLTMSDTVKQYFGFKNNTYSQDAVHGVFIAEHVVIGLVYADNIIVEIPSLGLECFDSSISGRRNILKFVPNDKANTTHKKEYVSQFPVFIGIRNDKETFINSIQVRFLDTENVPLKITGTAGSCEAILIIED